MASMLTEDDYIKNAMTSLDYLENIIQANYSTTKNKKVNIIAFPVDDGADDFKFENIFGEDVTDLIVEVFIGTAWTPKNFSGNIAKTDSSYFPPKAFVRLSTTGHNIGRVVFNSIEADSFVLSLSPVKKLEYLMNGQNGVSLSGSETETILSIDNSNNMLVTSLRSYSLKHSDYIDTLSTGDTIQPHTMLDKIMETSVIDGYVKVRIKSEFSHVASAAKSDINIITEIGSL